jgi:hypothetical protein
MTFLKKLYCTDFETFLKILGKEDVYRAGENFHQYTYWLNKFLSIKENLFNGLCQLDDDYQQKLWDYFNPPNSQKFIKDTNNEN